MLCERCKKKDATMLMQKLVNGQKTNINLCSDCAGEMMTADMLIPISFDNLFKGFLDHILTLANAGKQDEEQFPDISCPVCKTTYETFKKTGRLGCYNCYSVFRNELDGIFKNVQGGGEHRGKYPQRLGAELKSRREVERLKEELTRAVKNEEYELAADLRDKIRAYN